MHGNKRLSDSVSILDTSLFEEAVSNYEVALMEKVLSNNLHASSRLAYEDMYVNAASSKRKIGTADCKGLISKLHAQFACHNASNLPWLKLVSHMLTW